MAGMITESTSQDMGPNLNAVFADLSGRYASEPIPINFRANFRQYKRSARHGLYPYPARLLPHIPDFVMSSGFVPPDSVVLDPFCGSGTVLLAAQEAGYESIGFEINPVASLIARVKTSHVDPDKLMTVGAAIVDSFNRSYPSEVAEPPRRVQRWYREEDAKKLAVLGSLVRDCDPGATSDALQVAFALTVREMSLTDPRIPVPVRPYKDQFETHDAGSLFTQKLTLIVEAIREASVWDAPTAAVTTGDSRQLIREVPEGRRQLVAISSPPYGAAQKYLRSTSIESAWLGFTSAEGIQPRERLSIGRERILSTAANPTVTNLPTRVREQLSAIRMRSPARADVYAHYFLDMLDMIQGMASRSDLRRVCLVLGTNHVSGYAVETHALVNLMMQQSGFRVILALEDQIRGRSLLTTRAAPPTKSEFVYFYER